MQSEGVMHCYKFYDEFSLLEECNYEALDVSRMNQDQNAEQIRARVEPYCFRSPFHSLGSVKNPNIRGTRIRL